MNTCFKEEVYWNRITYGKEIKIIIVFNSFVTQKSNNRMCCFSGEWAGKAQVRQHKNIQLVNLHWKDTPELSEFSFPQVKFCAPLNSLPEISQWAQLNNFV